MFIPLAQGYLQHLRRNRARIGAQTRRQVRELRVVRRVGPHVQSPEGGNHSGGNRRLPVGDGSSDLQENRPQRRLQEEENVRIAP